MGCVPFFGACLNCRLPTKWSNATISQVKSVTRSMVLFIPMLHELPNPNQYSSQLCHQVTFHSMHCWCYTKSHWSDVRHCLVNLFLSVHKMFNCRIGQMNGRKDTIPQFECKSSIVTNLIDNDSLSNLEVCSNNYCQSTPPTPKKSSDFSMIFLMSTPSECMSKIMCLICTNWLEYLVNCSVHRLFTISLTLGWYI